MVVNLFSTIVNDDLVNCGNTELGQDWDGTKTEPIFSLFYNVPFKV